MLKSKQVAQEVEFDNKMKKENDFKNFLYERKVSYAQNIFSKYSDNELFKKGKDYSSYNSTEVGLQEAILYTTIPISIAISIFATYHLQAANLYAGDAMIPALLMVLAILMISAGIVLSPFFRKFVFKKWLKNHYDELLNHFLKDTPVSQDVMKRFIDVYGKEELAIMMSEKSTLTCGDIFSYVNNSKSKNEVKKQREKINEALKQLQ